jgi:hypothetical protein
MYKTALAAISLALSLGLLTNPVSADDQSSQGQGSGGNSSSSSSNSGGSSSSGGGNSSNSGGTNNQDSSSSSGGSNSNSSGNNSGTNSSSKSDSSSSTKTSTSTKAAPAAPAPVYVQTYGSKYNIKPMSTSTTMTSTGAQKSTSTTTKTASIGKAGAAAPATTKKAAANKDEIVTLQESDDKKYTATKNKQWQLVVAYINLKAGQEGLPLTMTVTNQGYTGINMVLGGNKLASDKDFKGTNLRMQMTGALAAGDNKLETQLFGPIGSKLSWKLTTLKPTITSVKPGTAALDNEITLTGRNFSKLPEGNLVYVGNKIALVKKGTPNPGKEIVFNLPKDILTGKQNVVVSVGGMQSKPIELVIKGAPVVTGVDLISAPPGQEMTISGKGFSAIQSENTVTIGGVGASITSSTTRSITVTIPELPYPSWYQPIVVKTGGVESNNTIKINVQMRVIPNAGVPEE